MSVSTEATEDDLAEIQGKAEIVNGVVVRMPPGGGTHNYASGEIVASLWAYARDNGVGHAASGNAAFMVNLPNRRSFSPDAAYYMQTITRKFFQGAPAFAVEVRSDSDRGRAGGREMAEKRADYFAAGTLVVWDVDLGGEDVVRSFRSDSADHPTVYRRGETASAEPAVPGWSMAVDDLWP